MTEEEKKSPEHLSSEKESHGFVAKINWFQRIKDFNFHSFFATASYGRTLALLGIILIVVTLPITVVVLQQKTQLKQSAHFADCPVIEAKCGTDTEVQSWCGRTYASTDLVNIQTDINCGNVKCTPQYNSTVCGWKPPTPTPFENTCTSNSGNKCAPANQPCSYLGSYVETSGICDIYHRQACCKAAPPTPTPDTTCKSSSGVTGKCYINNSCGGGMHEIDTYKGKACPTGFRICCAAGAPTPWYDCQTNGAIAGNIIKHTSTSSSVVGQCASNLACQDPSSGLVIIPDSSTAVDQAKKQLCVPPTLTALNTGIVCGANHEGTCYDWDVVKTSQPVVCPNGLWASYQTKTNSNDGTACGNWDRPGGQTTISCCVPPPPVASDAVKCGPNNAGICYWHQNIPPDNWNQARCSTNDVTTSNSKACWEYDTATLPSCSTLRPGSVEVSNTACNTDSHPVNTDSRCCAPGAATPTPSKTCKSENGQCIASHNSCPSGYTRNLNLDITCGATSNTICCTPNASPTSGGGGGGGGGGATPTPSCTNGKATKFAMNIKLPGIGEGDFENHTPEHADKHASVVIKDDTGKVIQGSSHDLSHALKHANGNGKLGLGRDATPQFACGRQYYVEVKIPGYVTIKKEITYGDVDQTIEVSENDIIPGDIVSAGTDNFITPDNQVVGDDQVTIADYNIYRACHDDPSKPIEFKNGDKTYTLNCSDLINLFDFSDGGIAGTDANGISEFADNYNLWFRGYLRFNNK